MSEVRIGYKLAVGVCKDEGFFPVVVKLEIPKEAEVVEPTVPGFKVVCNKIPSVSNFSVSLFGEEATISFPKYRTNKCKVLNTYALDGKERPNWNRVGYSLYGIAQYMGYRCRDITEYHEKTELVSNLDLSHKRGCSEGIHFFETEEIAKTYYFEDIDQWFSEGINVLNEELKNLSFYYRVSKDCTAYSFPLPINDAAEVLYKRYTGATDINCFSERYL